MPNSVEEVRLTANDAIISKMSFSWESIDPRSCVELGYYKDGIFSLTMKGLDGKEKIGRIMDTLRKNPPAQIGDYKVNSFRDYKTDTIRALETGEVKPTGLPTSNVLYFDLTDAAWLCVRPSGTEPKVKFYYGIKGTSLEDADAKSAALGEKVLAMINEML